MQRQKKPPTQELTQMDGINLNLTMLSENLNKCTLKKGHCQYYL
jgi:hypothetical protein